MDISSYIGELIPHTYNVSYIVLAYFVCLAGCLTALELLHRRTSARGLYNWFLLLGSATSMGAVAIWSMHYIGDQAIEMMNGQPEFRIAYRSEFTAGSFVLPIGVVALAFYYFHQSETVNAYATIIGGFMTGLAACGMHYTGEGGVSNYDLSYKWSYVFCSAIVAVIANTVGLGVFFYLHVSWKDFYLKRIACASLIAAAVTGMHWIATFGTLYRLKESPNNNDASLSRRAIVIIVIALSIGCCVFLLALALIGRRSRQKAADRAQEVVLACAMFDPQGRIMVKPDGLLPSRKVTNAYIEQEFEEVFDIGHPAFCWIFRASRCWQAVTDHIQGVRAHLRAASTFREYRSNIGYSSNDLSSFSLGDGIDDFSLLFKELFCVAAQDLANLVQKPLQGLGMLYEGMMDTGTLYKPTLGIFSDPGIWLDRGVRTNDREQDRGDRGTIGRGQLLFTVRRLNCEEASDMQASGFRFAFLSDIGHTLAHSMEVSKKELSDYMDRLWGYSEKESTLEQGVYVTCFALRPLFQRGFDVLVRQDSKNLLPTTNLRILELEEWHLAFLRRFDNCTIATCCSRLRSRTTCFGMREMQFASKLYDGLMNLTTQLEEPYFQEARLIARPFKAPCHLYGESYSMESASLIVFRIIVDAHEPSILNTRFEFTSSRLFLCQQHALKGSPDREGFGKVIHREFSKLMQNGESSGSQRAIRTTKTLPYLHIDFSRPPPSPSSPSRWSVPVVSSNSTGVTANSQAFVNDPPQKDLGEDLGVVHEKNDVISNVLNNNNSEETPDEAIQMTDLGAHSSASTALFEKETFADELLAFTIDERRRPHRGRVEETVS